MGSLRQGKPNDVEELMSREFDGKERVLELLVESFVQDKKWTKAKRYLVELLNYEAAESIRFKRMLTLAQVCLANGEYLESESWCLRAQALQGKVTSPRNSQYLHYELVALLAQIWKARGNHDEAQAYTQILSESQPGLEGTSKLIIANHRMR